MLIFDLFMFQISSPKAVHDINVLRIPVNPNCLMAVLMLVDIFVFCILEIFQVQ